ncbi:MAG: VWA domain-containing protein [Gammaproteobacteria bacterium]|nr:VWA domain-containing protein [Gammaproteobacteria bacterium]
MARRRAFNVISMSFLDAMTCGFGAVILFFMIITANVDLRHDEVLEDRSAEARRLELQVDVGRRNLAQLREALALLLEDIAAQEAARRAINVQIEQTRAELERLLEDANANEEMIEQLRAELAELESETESLSAESVTVEDTGNFIRAVRGEGYRQYLTGLRMGGERVVILVDASTSMLDRTLPLVLRARNMPDEQKKLAPKWQQVVNTVDWLTAQLIPGTQFQLIAFNSEAWAVIEGTDGQWLTATDGSELERAVEALRDVVPGECPPVVTEQRSCGATSLANAFNALSSLSPRPDNVYLLVDGLPTMGEVYPNRSGVSGRERVDHFNRARRGLPRGVPINVLLYALEGDPLSAPAYWTLALETGGSMMAPSEDWP